MAQKVQVLLVDDINGAEAAESVSFSLEGLSYEIDLTAANAKKLRDDFATWVGHARRSGGRKSSRRGAATTALRRGDLSAVRVWARNNGHKVSDRGRISADVLAAYDKANG
ncbi:MAG: Lsr2 family protein [Allobranchiibius sp.]